MTADAPDAVYRAICDLLDRRSVVYRRMEHAPTFTSEESARVRGESVRIGGKALLLKAGDHFGVYVLSAALRLDSAAVKRHRGVRSVRFATAAELLETTGLVPGSLPPFGKPILPFDLYADPSVLENDRIAFNAGSLTRSIIMSAADYVSAAAPQVFRFAASATPLGTPSASDGPPARGTSIP